MFFGKNKTSLRISRPHPILVEGSEYYIVDNVRNPTKIEVGVGISKVLLKDKNGQEFVVEGNATKIKEFLIPFYIFENVEGPEYKLKLSVGSLQKNTFLKETNSIHPDEKIYLGYGTSERYFIEKGTNKVIKFIGNPSQIKNIIEQVEKPKPLLNEIKSTKTDSPKIQIIEKIIVKETLPPINEETLKGERGDVGPRGERGPAGPQGVPGPKGPMGPKGEQGEIGPQGPQGEKGEQGEIGPLGPIGAQGKQGPKGKDGKQGPAGPQGPMGPQGPIGPIGPQGEQGIQGPKGEKGDRGLQGSKGDMGPAGPQGPQGIQGPAGESSVVEAKFPLVLEEGVLSFNSEHVSGVLEQLKNNDIQKAINQIALATPGGGGAVDIALNGDKVIRSVNTVNFVGNNVTVTRRRKNVDITISGGTGGGGGITGDYVRSLKSPDGSVTLNQFTGDIEISVLPAKSVAGTIQYRATSKDELAAQANFKLNTSTQNLELPKGLCFGSTANAFLTFSDGTTQGTRPNIFTEGLTAPIGSSILAGDRWLNTDDGKLYTAITDPGTTYPIWVQFGIGGASNTSGANTVSIHTVVGTTGATYQALSTDYYIGVSYAGPVTVTLPSSPESGREIVVKDESGNAGSGVSRQITIIGATLSDKIDNQSSAILNLNNGALHFIYRNGWRII